MGRTAKQEYEELYQDFIAKVERVQAPAKDYLTALEWFVEELEISKEAAADDVRREEKSDG